MRTAALLPIIGLAALLWVGAASDAGAQTPLTIRDAVDTALAHNAALRATRAGLGEADAGVTEARAAFFPRVTVTETWQRGDEPVFVFGSLLSARRFTAANFAIDALNHPDAIGFFRTSLGVEQVLFDGGRRRAATEGARVQRQMAAAAADTEAAELALKVTQAFGRVVSAQAEGRAASSAIDAAREDLATAERRRDLGTATDADVLSLSTHVIDLEQRSIEADAERAAAAAELRYLMGTSTEYVVLEPTDQGDERERIEAAPSAPSRAIRPDVRRAERAERLADTTRRQVRSALLPQVLAQAAVQSAGTGISDRASSWIVGGELRWTFSTGGAELARLKSAAAARARAAADREDAEARAEFEATAAAIRLQAARQQRRVGEAAVTQARESQRIVRDRFEAGLATTGDVLRASAAVLDAERRRTTALVGALVARAELTRALGAPASGEPER